MPDKLTLHTSVSINAPIESVWQALTNPAMIKEYMFGTNTVSDWQKGSSITYSGIWDGKPYEDKGVIIDIVPMKLLHTTFYSSFSGKEDSPENYANIIYTVDPLEGGTKLTIAQDNLDDDSAVEYMKGNWDKTLEGLKNLLEK